MEEKAMAGNPMRGEVISWYAAEIGNLAREASWAYPRRWDEIQQCLRAALDGLYRLGSVGGVDGKRPLSSDCPFEICDGMCRPWCPPPK